MLVLVLLGSTVTLTTVSATAQQRLVDFDYFDTDSQADQSRRGSESQNPKTTTPVPILQQINE